MYPAMPGFPGMFRDDIAGRVETLPPRPRLRKETAQYCRLRKRHRTNRTAIDSGGDGRHIEPSIEPPIPAAHGLPTDIGLPFRVGRPHWQSRNMSEGGGGSCVDLHNRMLVDFQPSLAIVSSNFRS